MTTSPQTRTGVRGLRKQTKTRQRVLSAAGKILRDEGYSGLTMERVAAESGVAKTTLYRQWPTKAALCMDLYLDVAGRELQVPDTGDVATDLKHIASTVVYLQTRTVAGPAFMGLIAEGLVHPRAQAGFLAEFAQRRREVTRSVLKRAIQRGELRADTDVDLVIDALGGAVTFRLLQGHAPLTKRFTDGLVALVLSGCATERAPEKVGIGDPPGSG
jgi:AcrR family transcriptional regulator